MRRQKGRRSDSESDHQNVRLSTSCRTTLEAVCYLCGYLSPVSTPSEGKELKCRCGMSTVRVLLGELAMFPRKALLTDGARVGQIRKVSIADDVLTEHVSSFSNILNTILLRKG